MPTQLHPLAADYLRRLNAAAGGLSADRRSELVDGIREHIDAALAQGVSPTATLVGKLFGIRYLATLFGLTLLSHQIGGFLGAYLGGLAIAHFGDYQWMWYADIALSAAAALVNLPIREARIEPVPVAA